MNRPKTVSNGERLVSFEPERSNTMKRKFETFVFLRIGKIILTKVIISFLNVDEV